MAKRGWQVTVVDAGIRPASGASGLPVGLYSPYFSADHNFTSQITAVGVHFTQKLARQFLTEGLDWLPSGVMSRKNGGSEHWHTDAGWIKPDALVKACLSQANITWRGSCKVERLHQNSMGWTLFINCKENDSEILIQSDMVVIAAANQSENLLKSIPNAPKISFQAVRGQVTYGNFDNCVLPAKPTYPINGGGSYIQAGNQWLVGASYDRDNVSLETNIRDQINNFERLEKLIPTIATQLKPDFEHNLVKNWVGIRCATTDRLPIVGEVANGLWICTAMASRGLTFAPMCAELLATLCHGEVPPLNPRLVKALSIRRYMT